MTRSSLTGSSRGVVATKNGLLFAKEPRVGGSLGGAGSQSAAESPVGSGEAARRRAQTAPAPAGGVRTGRKGGTPRVGIAAGGGAASRAQGGRSLGAVAASEGRGPAEAKPRVKKVRAKAPSVGTYHANAAMGGRQHLVVNLPMSLHRHAAADMQATADESYFGHGGGERGHVWAAPVTSVIDHGPASQAEEPEPQLYALREFAKRSHSVLRSTEDKLQALKAETELLASLVRDKDAMLEERDRQLSLLREGPAAIQAPQLPPRGSKRAQSRVPEPCSCDPGSLSEAALSRVSSDKGREVAVRAPSPSSMAGIGGLVGADAWLAELSRLRSEQREQMREFEASLRRETEERVQMCIAQSRETLERMAMMLGDAEEVTLREVAARELLEREVSEGHERERRGREEVRRLRERLAVERPHDLRELDQARPGEAFLDAEKRARQGEAKGEAVRARPSVVTTGGAHNMRGGEEGGHAVHASSSHQSSSSSSHLRLSHPTIASTAAPYASPPAPSPSGSPKRGRARPEGVHAPQGWFGKLGERQAAADTRTPPLVERHAADGKGRPLQGLLLAERHAAKERPPQGLGLGEWLGAGAGVVERRGVLEGEGQEGRRDIDGNDDGKDDGKDDGEGAGMDDAVEDDSLLCLHSSALAGPLSSGAHDNSSSAVPDSFALTDDGNTLLEDGGGGGSCRLTCIRRCWTRPWRPKEGKKGRGEGGGEEWEEEEEQMWVGRGRVQRGGDEGLTLSPVLEERDEDEHPRPHTTAPRPTKGKISRHAVSAGEGGRREEGGAGRASSSCGLGRSQSGVRPESGVVGGERDADDIVAHIAAFLSSRSPPQAGKGQRDCGSKGGVGAWNKTVLAL